MGAGLGVAHEGEQKGRVRFEYRLDFGPAIAPGQDAAVGAVHVAGVEFAIVAIGVKQLRGLGAGAFLIAQEQQAVVMRQHQIAQRPAQVRRFLRQRQQHPVARKERCQSAVQPGVVGHRIKRDGSIHASRPSGRIRGEG